MGLARLLIVLFAGLILGGCYAQFVPAYDPTLSDDLKAANRDAQILFEAVRTTPDEDGYAQLSGDYNDVIGRLEAVRQRAAARPVPPLPARLEEVVERACGESVASCQSASPSSLSTAIRELRMMRERHVAGALPSTAVPLFKDSFDLAMARALTVEAALRPAAGGQR